MPYTPSLKEVLDQGSTLFIDELNARLHPLLVRNIILTFLSPEINIRNAQLVFTTHDIWQFSNELLRRDRNKHVGARVPELGYYRIVTSRGFGWKLHDGSIQRRMMKNDQTDEIFSGGCPT